MYGRKANAADFGAEFNFDARDKGGVSEPSDYQGCLPYCIPTVRVSVSVCRGGEEALQALHGVTNFALPVVLAEVCTHSPTIALVRWPLDVGALMVGLRLGTDQIIVFLPGPLGGAAAISAARQDLLNQTIHHQQFRDASRPLELHEREDSLLEVWNRYSQTLRSGRPALKDK
jgi:hypothetical protein